jgi:hypothetical protein
LGNAIVALFNHEAHTDDLDDGVRSVQRYRTPERDGIR